MANIKTFFIITNNVNLFFKLFFSIAGKTFMYPVFWVRVKL